MFSVVAGVVLAVLAISIAFASANEGKPTSGNIPAKQAELQWVAAQQTAAAQEPHAPKDPSRTVAASCPQTIIPGIFRAGEESDYIMHTNTLNNVAVANSSLGAPYTLWAGALQSNPQQGVILVQLVRIDPCATPGENPINPYLMPTQAGAITMNSINGDSVTFQTANGTTGTFDFVTNQFAA